MSDRRQLAARCRHLHGHGPRTPADTLKRVAAWCEEHDVRFDGYGEGTVLENLEQRVAGLLGFQAARFMPSGTMAQQIALRVHAERAGHPHFGMHPTSHVELHEQRGYSHLHGLRATLVGPAERPLLAEHLRAVPERLAALLIELPIREAGGQLPTWEALVALKDEAHAKGVPLHLDGARLWSCAPAYNQTYDTICEGFASAYVSFYKSIGALPGAMLLGDDDLIARAAVWQRRHGGTLHTQVANAASATMRLETMLARMPRWLDHARGVAAALAAVDGVTVLPDPPHTHMMHLVLDVDPETATDGRDRVAETEGIWLFGGCRPGPLPGTTRLELAVIEAGLQVSPEEAAAGFRTLLGVS